MPHVIHHTLVMCQLMLTYINEVLSHVTNIVWVKQLTVHSHRLLCQAFTANFVSKAMPIHLSTATRVITTMLINS